MRIRIQTYIVVVRGECLALELDGFVLPRMECWNAVLRTDEEPTTTDKQLSKKTQMQNGLTVCFTFHNRGSILVGNL